jgi:predicted thioesterase
MGPDAVNEDESSEISFEEVCTVDADQTAKCLFGRLSHGSAYANQLLEGLATAYLIAIMESVCIREMFRAMDLTTEVIVGTAVNIRHRAPVPPGKQVWLRGRTTHLGERKATFAVQAFDDHEIVCEGTMTLVATSREVIERRLALKLHHDGQVSLRRNESTIRPQLEQRPAKAKSCAGATPLSTARLSSHREISQGGLRARRPRTGPLIQA